MSERRALASGGRGGAPGSDGRADAEHLARDRTSAASAWWQTDGSGSELEGPEVAVGAADVDAAVGDGR